MSSQTRTREARKREEEPARQARKGMEGSRRRELCVW